MTVAISLVECRYRIPLKAGTEICVIPFGRSNSAISKDTRDTFSELVEKGPLEIHALMLVSKIMKIVVIKILVVMFIYFSLILSTVSVLLRTVWLGYSLDLE